MYSSRHFIDGTCSCSNAGYKYHEWATFYPFVVRLFMSSWYFVVLVMMDSSQNLSLQYVNYINCIVICGLGVTCVCGGGGRPLYGCPIIHNMSCFSMVL